MGWSGDFKRFAVICKMIFIYTFPIREGENPVLRNEQEVERCTILFLFLSLTNLVSRPLWSTKQLGIAYVA